jgi:hypothetical protein
MLQLKFSLLLATALLGGAYIVQAYDQTTKEELTSFESLALSKKASREDISVRDGFKVLTDKLADNTIRCEGVCLVVNKSKHQLLVINKTEVVYEYKVNVRAEKEDREVWEDDQTPEGHFFIETMERMEGHSWRRWMRLNTMEKAREIYVQAYPEGRAQIEEFERTVGKIDSDQRIRQFNLRYPRQKMLRGVGIHGGYREGKDWTQGCVALNNHDIDQLFAYLLSQPNGGNGTEVFIKD